MTTSAERDVDFLLHWILARGLENRLEMSFFLGAGAWACAFLQLAFLQHVVLFSHILLGSSGTR